MKVRINPWDEIDSEYHRIYVPFDWSGVIIPVFTTIIIILTIMNLEYITSEGVRNTIAAGIGGVLFVGVNTILQWSWNFIKEQNKHV